MTSDEEKERKLQNIRDSVEAFAEAKSQRVYLEHFRSSRRAQLMKDAQLNGATSAVEQQREAERHPDYIEILEGIREATYKEARAYWELRIAEMQWESWRTRMANQREEMRRYGTG